MAKGAGIKATNDPEGPYEDHHAVCKACAEACAACAEECKKLT